LNPIQDVCGAENCGRSIVTLIRACPRAEGLQVPGIGDVAKG